VALAAGAVVLGGVVATPAAQAATIPTPSALCTYQPPTTTPVLDSFTFAPLSVDVRTGAKTFAVTATAHDTVALTSLYVGFAKDSSHSSAYGTLARTAGTATNGTWKGKVTVARWVVPGAWTVQYVQLGDVKRGSAVYSPSGGFATPNLTTTWNPAWPKTLTVTSIPDITPPVISSLVVSTKAVNTTKAAAKVTVTAVVRDSQSGVSGAFVQAGVLGAPKAVSSGAFLALSKKKYTYVGTFIVPTWAGKGTRTWSLSVSAYDRMYNQRSLTTAQIAAKHWQSTLKVTSLTDTTSPKLTSFRFTPASVDARAAVKKVAFTIKATDTMSGLVPPSVTFTSPHGVSTYASTITAKTGTIFSRTYTGYVLVPRCGDPGTWTASVVVRDLWGHSVTYSTAALKAKHFAVNLKVNDIDAIAPDVTGPSTLSAGSPVALTFSEPVLFKNSIGSTLDVSVDGSTAAGAWVCRNTAGTVVTCDANGAAVKTATFTPTTALTSGQFVDVSAKATYPAPTGIYDLAGNPLGYVGVFVSVT
jgi:hypothetical protein